MKKTNKILVIVLILLLTITASFTYARYYSSYSATISLNIREPKYTVTFNSNGGTGTMQSQIFSYGAPQNLTANGFINDGYNFDGWNTASDGSGTTYTDEQEISNLTTVENDSIPLYAQWSLESGYLITYLGMSGSGLPTSIVPNAPLSVNFGATQYAITSVTMGGVTLNPASDYSFVNNTLSITSVTGSVVITGVEPVSVDYVIDNEDPINKTGLNVTQLSNFLNVGGITAISSSKTITKIDISIPFTNTSKKDYAIVCNVNIGNNNIASNTQTISGNDKSGTLTYSLNVNIPGGEVFVIAFERGSTSWSGNQKVNISNETITFTFAS